MLLSVVVLFSVFFFRFCISFTIITKNAHISVGGGEMTKTTRGGADHQVKNCEVPEVVKVFPGFMLSIISTMILIIIIIITAINSENTPRVEMLCTASKKKMLRKNGRKLF